MRWAYISSLAHFSVSDHFLYVHGPKELQYLKDYTILKANEFLFELIEKNNLNFVNL